MIFIHRIGSQKPKKGRPRTTLPKEKSFWFIHTLMLKKAFDNAKTEKCKVKVVSAEGGVRKIKMEI